MCLPRRLLVKRTTGGLELTRKTALSAALWVLPLIPALLLPGLGVLASLVAVLVILFFVRRARQPTFSFWPADRTRSLLLGVLAGLAIGVGFESFVEPMIERLTGDRIALEGLGEIEGNLSNYLMLLVLGLLFGGVAEELIFRGFAIGWGTIIFGKRTAVAMVFVSATVFGLSHLYQGIAGVITTGLIGLLFGIIYLAFDRRLAPAIAAHMTVNAYSITLLYLGVA